MTGYISVLIAGLEAYVLSVIDSTNYRGYLTVDMFLRAGVSRLYGDDHSALDMLFEALHKDHPEFKDWPYEDEDDLLLANKLIGCANLLKQVLVPMLPNGAIARFHACQGDVLMVSVEC